MSALYPSAKSGIEDEAEKHLVRVLEERRARASSAMDVEWDASVEGERPPLRGISVEGIDVFDPPAKEEQEKSFSGSNRLVHLARKVCNMKSQGQLSDNHGLSPLESIESSPLAGHAGGHKKRTVLEQIEEENEEPTEGKDVFFGVGGEGTEIGLSQFSRANTDTDRLFSAALAVDETFKQDEETASVVSDSAYSEAMDDEMLPLTGAEDGPQGQSKGGWFGYGSAEDGEARRRKKTARKKQWRKRRKKLLKSFEKSCCYGHRFSEVFHPVVCVKAFFHFVTTSWFTKLGLPALIMGCVLFYYMGNPTMDFMNKATASWWLIFVARQTLTLELALITEFLIIDCFALRSRWLVKLLGPLLTLFIINAKGWSFIAISWALWDLFILHGDDKFQQNWLFNSGIPIFSPLNNGGRILYNKMYLRILVAMAIAGLATAIKRTVVALYFGKKTFFNYKPRLEKILAEIVLITEVAELASEAETIAAMTAEGHRSVNEALTEKKRKGMLADTKWNSLKQFESTNTGKDLLGQSATADVPPEQSDVDDVDSDSEPEEEKNSDDASDNADDFAKQRRRISSLGFTRIKQLLDRWEEPKAKRDKASGASISDILKFRKALSYMDEKFPFSLLFGPVSTRDECIKSSQRTYRRLMNLEPADSRSLSFDVIGLLAFDADGVEDERKMLDLKDMFRPGRFNEITLVAFVQACDSLYKQLRYFRASVGNASIIDRVLEQIVDDIFFFMLTLLILIILDFNPWPLLVSVSTLLVSFAFAIGPSLSRYIEGMLMIVIRRPYDLGDRICIQGQDLLTDSGVQYSWFVEDITIFSTTLRFGITNEVATVDNGSIAKCRIVNYNRSPSALVTLKLRFNMATQDQLVIFLEAIESFVRERPRIWNHILFFRCEDIDKDGEKMEFTMRVRHIKAWQDASSILMNRSELLAFCFEIADKLEINYDLPPKSFRVTNSFAPSQNANESSATAAEDESPSGDSKAAKALFMMMKGGKS